MSNTATISPQFALDLTERATERRGGVWRVWLDFLNHMLVDAQSPAGRFMQRELEAFGSRL